MRKNGKPGRGGQRAAAALAALSLLLSPALLRAGAPAAGPRPRPGATLGVSLRNEMVYAMQQAVDWLAAVQLPCGAWGETNRPGYRLTALTRFALQSTRRRQAAAACRRASGWLARNIPAAPPGLSLDACAWHLLGEAGRTNAAAAAATAAAVRRAAGTVEAAAAPAERALWAEALAAASAAAPAADAAASKECSTNGASLFAAWPPAADAPVKTLWQTARALNRRHGGILRRKDGETVDWRRDLAERLICSQRRDLDAGGAYWPAARDGSPAAEQTAFALLLFLEL